VCTHSEQQQLLLEPSALEAVVVLVLVVVLSGEHCWLVLLCAPLPFHHPAQAFTNARQQGGTAHCELLST
jgi:hypothetical protein